MRDDRRRGQPLVPVSGFLSAAGVRFSDHPFPAGELGLHCGRHLPLLSGQSLHPAITTHLARFTHNETSAEVHVIHPSGLPLARNPRMERESFGCPFGSAYRRYQRRTPRAEPGYRALTWNYTADMGRTSDLRVRSFRATSCRNFFLVSTDITG